MQFSSTQSEFKHPEQFQLSPKEFLETFHNVSNDSECSFVILDVREDYEIARADLPPNNDKQVEIPKLNIPLNDVFQDEEVLSEIPKDKYIVCLCHHGVRSAYAAVFLKKKGFKSQNIEGGIHQISEIWEKISKN